MISNFLYINSSRDVIQLSNDGTLPIFDQASSFISTNSINEILRNEVRKRHSPFCSDLIPSFAYFGLGVE